MAVPKRKVSKARRNSRAAQTYKLTAPNLVECPQCHEHKLSHIVCPKCGYYDGEQAVSVDKKESK